MSVGPLRRSVGALGLVAMIPLAGMMVTGSLTAVDAATRATVTVIALLAVGRFASWGMRWMAASLEGTGQPPREAAATQGGRRATDHPVEQEAPEDVPAAEPAAPA